MGRNRKIEDPTLGRLLSGRNEPSVLEKEATLEAVLDEARPRRRFLFPALSVLSAATAAVVAFAIWPRDPEFLPRGERAANLALRCEPSPCRAGGSLLLGVRATEEAPHFGAFSRRPDGAVIWYAPAPNEKTKEAEKLGFQIDAEHTPGLYEVFGLFTREPMSRDQLKAALGDELLESATVKIVKRQLEIAR